MKYHWIFIIIIILSCSSGFGQEKTFPARVEKAQNAVVKISGETRFRLTKGGFRKAMGTGFFIDQKTVVTNFYVVFPMNPNLPIYVENELGKFQIKRVKHLSALHDLAVLEVETPERRMPFLERARPRKGSPFYIFGYPSDEIHSQGRYIEQRGADIILFANNISQNFVVGGAIGSPILNGQGKVVGILRIVAPNILVGISVRHLEELLSQQPLTDESRRILVRNEFERAKELANEGNALAQFSMEQAWNVREFYPVKIKLKQRNAWIQQSINQDYDLAQAFNMSKIVEGMDLHSFESIGSSSYLKTFMSGIFFFIRLYENGSQLDRKKIFDMMSFVAEGGLNQAQFIIGLMLEAGFGVKEDKKKSIQWIQQSANQGYEPAQNYLNQEPLFNHSHPMNPLIKEDMDLKTFFSILRGFRQAQGNGMSYPLLVNYVEAILFQEIKSNSCQQSVSFLKK